MKEDIGPLAKLIGSWAGFDGVDISPGKDLKPVRTEYWELTKIKRTEDVHNGDLIKFAAASYDAVFTEPAKEDPKIIHRETGYFLWCAALNRLYKVFTVPRCVTILAEGQVEPGATLVSVGAEQGRDDFGICQSQIMFLNLKTNAYQINFDLSNGEIKYSAITQLYFPKEEVYFDHKDSNRLVTHVP